MKNGNSSGLGHSLTHQFVRDCTNIYDHNSIFCKADIISFQMMYDVCMYVGGELNLQNKGIKNYVMKNGNSSGLGALAYPRIC